MEARASLNGLTTALYVGWQLDGSLTYPASGKSDDILERGKSIQTS